MLNTSALLQKRDRSRNAQHCLNGELPMKRLRKEYKLSLSQVEKLYEINVSTLDECPTNDVTRIIDYGSPAFSSLNASFFSL